MPEYIKQANIKTCGQTCIAMLSGKTEKDIIAIVGHSKGTKTKELVKALDALNIENSGRLKVIGSKTELPEIAIIKAIPKRRKGTSGGWHWVLKYGEKILDPWGRRHFTKLRFTSFIAIT